ncbi:type VI secretion system-associated protein TagF [Agrobacterium sp. a22-2]|uniref:type VI secretion system-associated protein TagF n=1 Tax=Agrobacterium sp. a22-2 TaxID=2283840 RepID=UPI001445104D|nr:type VI secretion system-associated protein TagF [Agrobacterium sp. a22-2]NKN36384.1 type VI secretion system-associated protein TagF [Agrobacterium sp. a22-2]
MDTTGYFGKVPAARDFVYHGLPVRLTEAWASMVSPWLAAARSQTGQDWPQAALTSPVWRFLLPGGVPGAADYGGCAGLMAGSIDGAGRVFPFAVLILSDGFSSRRPDATLDLTFDRIEPAMLAFMEGHFAAADFAAALLNEGRSLSAGASNETFKPVLGGGEDAACFIGGRPAWNAEAAVESYRPGAASTPCLDVSESYWWHDGMGPQRGPEFCVFRGPPGDTAAQPFFNADWRKAWQRRNVIGALEP